MNLFKKIISAAALTIAIVPATFVAGAISIDKTDEPSQSQDIKITDIPKDAKYMQFTLNFPKTDTYNFESNLSREDGYYVYAKDGVNSQSITFYITSSDTLSNDGLLNVGTITCSNEFKLGEISGVKILNESYVPSNDNGSDNSNGGSSGSNNNNSNNQNPIKHNVSISQTSGGKISTNLSSAKKGDVVTISLLPDEGYMVSDITVTKADGKTISVTKKSNNSYTFVMPDENVKISVQFEKQSTNNNKLPFTDVNPNNWYYDAVEYVYNAKLMSGTSDTTFSPDLNTTRGMIVTVLHRLDGQPAVSSNNNSFDDVDPSSYYSNAIYWAKENGIVSGYNDSKFGPNDNITREQMVTILNRYTKYKGIDVTSSSDLSNYIDASSISDYAVEPMKWAISNGLISGMGDGTISPNGNATRAQIATILMRFVENISK